MEFNLEYLEILELLLRQILTSGYPLDIYIFENQMECLKNCNLYFVRISRFMCAQYTK